VYRETLGKTIAMEGETKSKTVAKENKVGSHPGLPGSTRQVDRVSSGQLPRRFLPPPGPVPGPGRPARPVRVSKLCVIELIIFSFSRNQILAFLEPSHVFFKLKLYIYILNKFIFDQEIIKINILELAIQVFHSVVSSKFVS
jgi:hypothetical protein